MPEGLAGRDLWFGYGSAPVVRGVDVTMTRGEVVGLRGPSGCGKTTIGRLLGGLLVPDSGSVTVDAAPLPQRGVSPVQVILQHPDKAVDPRWRLREILAEAGTPDDALLAELSIAPGWMDRFPNELSGGELQRIAVARALLTGAPYLVADEISAMLDPITQAQLWHVLLRRVRAGELGVLAVSHDDDLLAVVADRVIDVQDGVVANIEALATTSL